MASRRYPNSSSTARARWDERRRWQRIPRADQQRMLRLLNGSPVKAEPVQLTFADDRRRAA